MGKGKMWWIVGAVVVLVGILAANILPAGLIANLGLPGLVLIVVVLLVVLGVLKFLLGGTANATRTRNGRL